MRNRTAVVFGWAAAAVALGMGLNAPAGAKTRRQNMNIQDSYGPAEAVKAQAWLDAAMTTPMIDLLQKADITNPAAMLEYGLALELGRPSASSSLSPEARAKLKDDYRQMLDLYLTPADKKLYPELADANFEQDAMLDNQEFWVDLAKQIGRRKEHVALNQTLPDDGGSTAGGGGGSLMTFIPDPQNEGNDLNLSKDLVLNRGMVNAAAGCAESAAGFAKTKKAQTVDITQTRLKPDEFTAMKATAARVYRTSYAVGIMACGSRDYFFKVADFATRNLGAFGALKDDPAAALATLSDPATKN